MVKYMRAMMRTQIALQSKTKMNNWTNYKVCVNLFVFMFVERLTSLSLPNTEIFCMTILFVLIKPLMHLNAIQLMNHCLLFMLIL